MFLNFSLHEAKTFIILPKRNELNSTVPVFAIDGRSTGMKKLGSTD